MSRTLEEIIADLEKEAAESTPEEKTAEEKTEEKTEEKSEEKTEEKTEEGEKTAEEKTEEKSEEVSEEDQLKKEAEEYDAAGRIIARAFADELEKISVTVTGMTPNTGAVPDNPALQVSNEEVHEGDVAKVQAILNKLTMGLNAKGPAGAVHEQNVPVAPVQSVAVDEKPVAADVRKVAQKLLDKMTE